MRVPLLVLHGDDDPFIDPTDVPSQWLIGNPFVTLVGLMWERKGNKEKEEVKTCHVDRKHM